MKHSCFFRRIHRFFAPQKGTATGISMGFSAGILAISLGTVAVVGNTVQTNKNVENSTVAYFSAERGIEYSLLDLSGHISGYEIEKGHEKGNLKTRTKEAKSQISIESRSKAESGQIQVPAKGRGTSPKDNEWNTLQKERGVTIPLYIDNTGR